LEVILVPGVKWDDFDRPITFDNKFY
jgi:hypothetical protein